MSPSVVEELKKDHEFILKVLSDAIRMGASSRGATEKLKAAKERLLVHLKTEDSRVYPFLSQLAENNAELKYTLHLLREDMQEITRQCLDFFSKYVNGEDEKGEDPMGFAFEFGRLYNALLSRIAKEENIFFEKYRQEIDAIPPTGKSS